jgi:3-oxoacyl-[acyl-carrier protein] reductase
MGQTAIVTGGSRGIGYAIAQKLLDMGYNVTVMHAHMNETIEKNLGALRARGRVVSVQGDVADARDRQRCLDAALSAFGRVDVLVNNAGVGPQKRVDLLEMTEESFDRVISINLKANMFFTQIVAMQMIAQEPVDGRRGTIVNIGSISAFVSSVSRGEYCVSKAGVSMLTQLYADRLASELIYVYEVRPGIIATDMTAVVKEKYDALFAQGICPIGRWGKPEDVAKAVALLCSGELPYSTGEVLNVDGGFHIRRL